LKNTEKKGGRPMKKALALVIITWFIIFSSSSFACSLCTELKKRGFPPEEINRTISKYFGASLKVSGQGEPFLRSDNPLFNIAIGKDGKIYPVKTTRQLQGVTFDGVINTHPVKIFVINGIDFIGLKTDETLSVLPAQKKQVVTRRQTAIKIPVITTENKASFKYSDEVIQVPPDIERR